MGRPLRSIVKEFPPRGPMQQFRLDSASAFHCIRCGADKTAKLVTVYGGDWNRLLCNGCYGRLLSIHEIKAGTGSDDDRVEGLAKLLLDCVSRSDQDEAIKRLKIAEDRAKYLSDRAVRFLATSEAVSRGLAAEPSLDWSPAVIGLCKAIECEVQDKVLVPLKAIVNGKKLESDIKENNLRRVASFCGGKTDHPPELGPVRFFLLEAGKRTTAPTSELLTALRTLIGNWPNSDWLFQAEGLPASLEMLSTRYRNPAAHADEVGKQEYEECHALTIGDKGVLWQLVKATQGRK